MVPAVDHDCVLKAVVDEQQKQIQQLLGVVENLQRQLAQLTKAVHGKKSEKMPSLDQALGTPPVSPEDRRARRAKNAQERTTLPTERVEHKVPDVDKKCPSCGGEKFAPLGAGRTTVVYEFVPARVVRREHVQEVLRCTCGACVLTAPGAPKVVEGGRYGASFLAHLVVAKCADHIPFYRLEKDFKRQGLTMPRSTMNDLFHRAAHLLAPLSTALLDVIRHRQIVQADETRLRMQDGGDGKPKTGFMWTFMADDDKGEADIGYVFANSRSGSTATHVLGGTEGILVVDAYSGYDAVTDADGRTRAGCHAHLRRYFHEALPTAPVAAEAIALILDLYRVEHEARARGIVRTNSHLEFRKERAAPARDRLKAWLDENLDRHPPKSPIGIAIRYGLKNWDALGQFLTDARVPLDNNASERALRRVALGRKNFLFVGDVVTVRATSS
jgi:transposase